MQYTVYASRLTEDGEDAITVLAIVDNKAAAEALVAQLNDDFSGELEATDADVLIRFQAVDNTKTPQDILHEMFQDNYPDIFEGEYDEDYED